MTRPYMSEMDDDARIVYRKSRAIILTTATFFVAATLWASAAAVDEVTSGQGKVVPAMQDQVVQSLEGGILREILVRADETVTAGQILARLDPIGAGAAVEDVQAKYFARLATIARLSAEVDEAAIAFPDALAGQDALIAHEEALFTARRDAFHRARDLIGRSRALTEDELARARHLRESGAASQAEVTRLERDLLQLEMQQDDLERDYFVKGRETLVQLRAEAASLAAELTAKQDQLDRQNIASPVTGIVKDVVVTTEGGVLPPNGALMTIVPLEDELIVEARIQPEDIAFIHPGLRATIKISAYDYAIYGALEGEVVSVSPDSIRDEVDPQQQYYRVYVAAEDFSLSNANGTRFPITPGMVATVDIHTGARTVLQYLLKPLNRAREALRER